MSIRRRAYRLAHNNDDNNDNNNNKPVVGLSCRVCLSLIPIGIVCYTGVERASKIDVGYVDEKTSWE